MRFVDRRSLWVILILAGFLAIPTRAAEIWVSPDGDDANPGTRERPLASVTLAQRQARELRRTSATPPDGGVRIVLRGGIHPLTAAWLFRTEDSGTVSSPTVIEAAPGEHPVLSGGIALEGWRLCADEITGLPAAARGHVWVAEAPRAGGRVLECRQLWVDGRKAVRARTPDDGIMERLTAWDRAGERAGIPAALAARPRPSMS
jgi:hypothetical protein